MEGLAMPFRLPDRAPDFVRRLPTPPLGLLRPVFQQLMAGLLRRHPEMFDRLGEYGRVDFLIDPVDLPVVFIMRPDPEHPLLTPYGRDAAPTWGAAVRGPLPRLISMVNGREDGDALFFSRDIVIEGDTEAVLALRNAIDDANVCFQVRPKVRSGSTPRHRPHQWTGHGQSCRRARPYQPRHRSAI